jgi:hypothetical protein
MSVQPFVRVEYQDFRDVADHREFRLRVSGPDGSTERRFQIASAAFGAGRVRLQDGPDVCYQKLLRALAAGETAAPDVITIDDLELAAYRDAHTPIRKRRPRPASSEPLPVFVPRPPARTPIPRLPVAIVAPSGGKPALQEGQRVSHAVFGVGVTTASDSGHTVVAFDQNGAKTFVTRLVQLDVLSAPRTWETSRRGTNRLRRTLSAPDEAAGEGRAAESAAEAAAVTRGSGAV